MEQPVHNHHEGDGDSDEEAEEDDMQNQRFDNQQLPHHQQMPILRQAPPPYDHLPNQQIPLQNAIPRQMTPVQYIKNLPMFKQGSDLLIFLHRFQSYCQALRIPQNMRASLLVAHLDDTALRGISRHLNDNITHEEVIELLKKSQGYAANNTDRHINEMASRKRLRTEKVMDYFVDLSRISELAYPNDDQRQVRDANLRQEFIKNINHPMISARLREHPTMPMEELLDLAVLLENCYEASKVPQTQVNFLPDHTEMPNKSENSSEDSTNAKLSNITNMIEALTINQIENQERIEKTEKYQYSGNRAPQELRTRNNQEFQNNNRRPYRSNSSPRFQENQNSQSDGIRRSRSLNDFNDEQDWIQQQPWNHPVRPRNPQYNNQRNFRSRPRTSYYNNQFYNRNPRRIFPFRQNNNRGGSYNNNINPQRWNNPRRAYNQPPPQMNMQDRRLPPAWNQAPNNFNSRFNSSNQTGNRTQSTNAPSQGNQPPSSNNTNPSGQVNECRAQTINHIQNFRPTKRTKFGT